MSVFSTLSICGYVAIALLAILAALIYYEFRYTLCPRDGKDGFAACEYGARDAAQRPAARRGTLWR